MARLALALTLGMALAPQAAARPGIDVRADALRRWRAVEGDTLGAEELTEESLRDVDGDGRAERLVATRTLCGATGNCPWLLYVSNRGRDRFVGEIGGESIGLGQARHHGLRDLTTYWDGGCASMAGTWSGWIFDGRAYRVVASIECECPGEEPDPDRPPQCPSAD